MSAAKYGPGFHVDVPEAEYHADRGSLSVSGAKVLLKAPALYRWQLDHPVHRDVFDLGAATHAELLGVGCQIELVDADSWRTKAAQEAREQARMKGRTPLLATDYCQVQAMVEAVRGHALAGRLLANGAPEVSAYGVDEETGVMRRARIDWLGDRVLVDVKTAASADPEEFIRAAVNYGYDMQAAWYQDLAFDLGHPADAFAFVVVEKTAPYLVTVIELPEVLVERGRRRNARALERFAACTHSGIWPGYVPEDQFATPDAPAWAVRQEVLA